MKNSIEVPQEIKNGTSDPVILLLDIYLKKMKSLPQRDIYTTVFTAVSFTIVMIWKQT